MKEAHTDSVSELRRLLQTAFNLRYEGGLHARASHARGVVDGYMRALLDEGTLTQAQLLTIVSEERCRADGPATRVLSTQLA